MAYNDSALRKALSTADPVLKSMIETLVAELEQERAISKAACKLADRYRDERDGARAATAATKSKVADAALFNTDVRSAISKAFRDGEASMGDGVERDSAEAARRLSKARDQMFRSTPAERAARTVLNADGSGRVR